MDLWKPTRRAILRAGGLIAAPAIIGRALGPAQACMTLTGAGGACGGGGGAAAVTWDPAHTDGVITLSGGNLIASVTTLPSAINFLSRATSGISSSSKVYWEVLGNTVPTFANALGLGFADGTFTVPQDNFLGSGASTLGYYGSTGAVFQGGGSIATLAQYASADVVGFAVDTVNSKIWLRVNSGGWNNDILANQNPATNTGGLAITGTPTLYPALVFRVDTADAMQVTGQFSSASWSFSAPAGFTHL